MTDPPSTPRRRGRIALLQAVRSGNLPVVSGTCGDRGPETWPGGIEAECHQCSRTWRHHCSGRRPAHRCRQGDVFLIDLAPSARQRVYREISGTWPARSAVQVAACPGCAHEVEAIIALARNDAMPS